MAEIKRSDLTVERENAVLVGVTLKNRPFQDVPEPLAELQGLVNTAGARVLGKVLQRRETPDQATYVGKGKVEELSDLAHRENADVIVFDNELQPAQIKNLEKRTDTKVVDRTELILDIFATRAQTQQARLQVELAQLEYLRPRLKRLWTHLERHGGGIGTRGPGEQQLETDRRLVDRRIADLKRRLAIVVKRKQREQKKRENELRVSLVGYTNAGKSTLLRQLTGADVTVADRLFATLDTRTRQWQISGWGKVLLSDTVGFIRDLPHDLVESFQATLEEATHAHLLLHVVDASDLRAEQQIEAVNRVLEDIGARNTPTILVLNKIDRIKDRATLQSLDSLYPCSVRISAQQGEGLAGLANAVSDVLGEKYVTAHVLTHAGNGRLLAYLAGHGEIQKKTYDGEKVLLRLRMPRHLLDRIDPAEATVTIDSNTPSGQE